MGIIDIGKPAPLRTKAVAQALADVHSRGVLAACVRRAKAVKEISRETGLPLPTTYRHVHRLTESGVLVVERSALTDDGKRYDLFRSRIRSARIEMDASGEHVVWELNEPVEARLLGIVESHREEATTW